MDDVHLPGNSVRLATFGRSFHWTNREEVLETLDHMIEPGGCVALFFVRPVERSGGPHDWYEGVIRRLNALSRETDGGPKPFDKGFVSHEFLLKNSAFSVVQDRGLLKWKKWTLRQLISFGLSRYKASRANLEAEEQEVRKAIKRGLRSYGDGPWYTLNQHRVVIASRPK